jgi:hypothetical protein
LELLELVQEVVFANDGDDDDLNFCSLTMTGWAAV